MIHIRLMKRLNIEGAGLVAPQCGQALASTATGMLQYVQFLKLIITPYIFW